MAKAWGFLKGQQGQRKANFRGNDVLKCRCHSMQDSLPGLDLTISFFKMLRESTKPW